MALSICCSGLAPTSMASPTMKVGVPVTPIARASSMFPSILLLIAGSSMSARMRSTWYPGMIRDQHLPFGARELSHAFLAPAGGIEDDLVAGSAIDVGAGVDRVGEHLVDGSVARLDPSDLAALMHLQWEFEPLRAEPQ